MTGLGNPLALAGMQFSPQYFSILGVFPMLGRPCAQAIIVGVMPPGFTLPKSNADIWTPLPIRRSKEWGGGRYLTVLGRLLWQMLLESLMLALVPCAAGLAAEYWGMQALLTMVPGQSQLPRMDAIHMAIQTVRRSLGRPGAELVLMRMG